MSERAEPTGAALSIELRIDQGMARTTLTRRDAKGRKVQREFANRASAVREARLQLAGTLATVKRLIGSRPEPSGTEATPPSWANVNAALYKLQLQSARLMGALARSGDLYDFRSFCEQALRPRGEAPAGRIVEVRLHGDVWFPFELLEIVARPRRPDVRDRQSLAAWMDGFLGYSAAVRRLPVDPDAGDEAAASPFGDPLELRGAPLPITLFHDATLAGAREEAAFFAARAEAKHLTVRGPWPSEVLPAEDAMDALAGALFDSRRELGQWAAQTQQDEIQHFACHCDTDTQDPDEQALRLASGPGESVTITYGDLDGHIKLEGTASKPERPGPLVFLNACGSAVVQLPYATSFALMFLENGNRGVIGTEMVIPDAVAAAVARWFYLHLLSGDTAGQALVAAKRRLASEYGNPLGLAYVMYADPDLKVTTKVPRKELEL